MESEKGWAVWSPDVQGIILYTCASREKVAIRHLIDDGCDWKTYVKLGFRTVEVTISYEKPQASDEEE